MNTDKPEADRTADDDVRVAIMRQGIMALHAMLYSQFKAHYNVVLAICPAGGREVSLVCHCESDEVVDGIKGVIARTLGEHVQGKTLQ